MRHQDLLGDSSALNVVVRLAGRPVLGSRNHQLDCPDPSLLTSSALFDFGQRSVLARALTVRDSSVVPCPYVAALISKRSSSRDDCIFLLVGLTGISLLQFSMVQEPVGTNGD